MKATIEFNPDRARVKLNGRSYLVGEGDAMEFKLAGQTWWLTQALASEIEKYPTNLLLAELARRGFDVTEAQQLDDRLISLENTMSNWSAEKPWLK